MNRSTRFWDGIAEKYAQRPVADEADYQRKLGITREYLRPDMEVLEFGCGTGSTAIIHAPYVKHVLATDVSPKMIEIAREKAANVNVTNVTFETSTVEDLDAEDGKLDVVMGHSILHLVEDRDAVITKVHRMLKRGGVFVTSTPCLGDTQKYIGLIAPIGRFLGIWPPIVVFTRKVLEESLTAVGFDLEVQWQPAKGKAVFIVARKSTQS